MDCKSCDAMRKEMLEHLEKEKDMPKNIQQIECIDCGFVYYEGERE